ncbi:leucine-rich repeat domain-containing protein [Intestinibacter bartlettii]|uniref:leucine-rich repeat domain-containing protein n=1 Tax=Intestinibacter bartlettii TaxID=261299 RepID=UPI003994534C
MLKFKMVYSYAFYNATALESVSIPESVTTMNEGAFANCTALSSVNLPSKLKTISYGLFASCSNLTKIEIPEGVTSIDGYAFYTCTSLKEINIPEKVESIGEAAFYYCAALESIEIPKSVDDIGSYAFDSCSNLTMSGYSSSAAKTYASENSIPFKTIRTALDYAKIVLVFVALGAIIYLIHKLKAIVKHKKYLKNNIDFEENIVLIDNEICKVEFIGKSKLKLVNGKEVQNNKKTLGTEFVGYKYNIENKSDSNIEVYIKYATVGDYTDKFNLDEQIPKGKKAKGFACLQKTNSLDNLKSVSGTIVVCNEKNNEVKVKSYDFKID